MDAAEFLASIGRGSSQPVGVPTVEAIYATGHHLFARERYADASRAFQTMLFKDPHDERGWLGLGECHERINQPSHALELYGWGSVLGRAAVRCHLARARLLRVLNRDDEADAALEKATELAEASDDETLAVLVARERGKTP